MINGWYYDKDGHCSAMGFFKNKKEAVNECEKQQRRGADLKDDNAISFI